MEENLILTPEYFNVALASSVVLFGFDGNELQVYIYRQKQEPYKGALMLPSAYVLPQESNEDKIRGIIKKYLQLDDIYLEQLKAFDKVYRNPLGRVVNIAFYALLKLDKKVFEQTDKIDGKWVNYNELPDLAFDHNDIVDYAKERLKRRVKRRPVGFNLLPAEFTIAQLQTLYESALGKEMDKRNFRKKIFKSELIAETGNMTDSEQTRKAAKLYKFDEDKYEKMTLKGYDFLF